MKHRVLILASLCLPLALAGCANNPYASNGTTADASGGAVLGALAGAVIGNQTGAPLAGAAIGAGLGGLAGYGVAHNGQATQNAAQPGYYAPPANNPQCPSGYVCTPQQPAPPPCPPGYTCTPQ
jgi:outer membrane lipoprotein SlyB